jgi:hypothetical protein
VDQRHSLLTLYHALGATPALQLLAKYAPECVYLLNAAPAEVPVWSAVAWLLPKVLAIGLTFALDTDMEQCACRRRGWMCCPWVVTFGLWVCGTPGIGN